MQHQRRKVGCPAWSGEFWEDGEFGYLSVHVADEVQHHPPGGWTLVRVVEDDDTETYVYRKVSSWLIA